MVQFIDAGGPQILKECQEIRKTVYPDGLPTGEAVITTGGNLPGEIRDSYRWSNLRTRART